MKHRSISPLALAAALLLAACAPTEQGADDSAEPSRAAESSAPAVTDASETAAPTPEGYDY